MINVLVNSEGTILYPIMACRFNSNKWECIDIKREYIKKVKVDANGWKEVEYSNTITEEIEEIIRSIESELGCKFKNKTKLAKLMYYKHIKNKCNTIKVSKNYPHGMLNIDFLRKETNKLSVYLGSIDIEAWFLSTNKEMKTAYWNIKE